MTAATAYLLPAHAHGQAPERQPPRRVRIGSGVAHPVETRSDRGAYGTTTAAMVEVSPPVANLLNRAQEGRTREDWKFVIDSLQRIIDEPDGSMLPAADDSQDVGVRYESASRYALYELAQLPPEGLRAYRLLYDGKARGLFERGQAAHDAAALRAVVNRYFMSRYGDDAADVLASWALDGGRPAVAAALLEDVLALLPDYDVPAERIIGKLAVCYALLGREADAHELVGWPDRPKWVEKAVSMMLTSADRVASGPDKKTTWPVVGGSSSRDGRMPAVAPTLVRDVPWRFDMPAVLADAWHRVVRGSVGTQGPFPVAQGVAADGRLYVRTPGGCTALDLEDLSVAWAYPREADSAPRRSRTPFRGVITHGDEMAPTDEYERPFEDALGESISVAHGLVFTLESFGEADATTQRSNAMTRLIGRAMRLGGNALAEPTAMRLVAHDAKDGHVRWDRGRTSDAKDELGDVAFRAVPISVGDHLWVPYQHQRDLFLAVLRPSDGSLVRSIPVCTLPDALENTEYPLRLAYADGMVYVPTEQQMLLAVDTDTHAVDWAYQYPGGRHADGEEIVVATRTLSSPPVVAGGLVILAPIDSGRLYALDKTSGRLRWSKPLLDGAHIIAADEQRVWIGGPSIECLTLVDGRPEWVTESPSGATGRAALAGDVVLVPTRRGLASFDATTGKQIDRQALAPRDLPLGNLLCLAHALYSVEPSSVRKYPDLAYMYRETLASYREDSDDLVVALRLAWLELFRDAPLRAYDVLEAIEPLASTSASDTLDAIARARVETLLTLAARAATGGAPARRLDLIENAINAARAGEDRLRTRLAKADQLERMGRHVEAAQVLWSMALEQHEQELMVISDQVEGDVRVALGRRLLEIEPQLTASERTRLQTFIGDELQLQLAGIRDGHWGGEVVSHLHAAATLPLSGAAGQSALVELAAWKKDRNQLEYAEALLREAIRIDADKAGTVSALMRLALLYAEPTQALWHAWAHCIDDLRSRFGDVVLADVPGLPEAARPVSPGETVANWADRMRERFSDRLTQARGAAGVQTTASAGKTSSNRSVAEPDGEGQQRDTAAPRLTSVDAPYLLADEIAWTYRVDNPPRRRVRVGVIQDDEDQPKGIPRLVQFVGERPAALVDRSILRYVNSLPDRHKDTVECRGRRDGEVRWQTHLELPASIDVELPPTNTLQRPRSAVSDGQIAVYNGRKGLFAVGLVTGKRLWIRPYDVGTMRLPSGSLDQAMAARDGRFAAMPRQGYLSLMRLADGSVIWERELRGEQVAFIRMYEDFVVTIDQRQQRVNVFDIADGRQITSLWFRQPDADAQIAELVYTGHVLCGPQSTSQGDSVVAYRLASGEPVWEMALEKPLVHLFEVAPGVTGMGLLGGDVRLVQAPTGEVIVDANIAHAGAVHAAILAGDVLVAQHIVRRQDQWEVRLTGIDVSSGEELWYRSNLATVRQGMPSLTEDGGVIPALIVEQRSDRRRQDLYAMVLLDVQTGVPLGPEVSVVPYQTGFHYNGDMDAGDGAIVIGSNQGLWGFATVGPQRLTQEGMQ